MVFVYFTVNGNVPLFIGWLNDCFMGHCETELFNIYIASILAKNNIYAKRVTIVIFHILIVTKIHDLAMK